MLLRLREESLRLSGFPGADELRGQLERLIDEFDLTLGGKLELSTKALFQRVRIVEHSYQAFVRAWDGFREQVGRAAAEEVRDQVGVATSWAKRWGSSLYKQAWNKREDLLRTDSDLVLSLDLRYAAELPLAEIADFLSLSPAAIQMRIASFESTVVFEFALNRIESQVPEGWRIEREPWSRVRTRGEVLLRRRAGAASQMPISLEFLPVWEDRESPVGRPRGMARPNFPRRSVRRIWVVIFIEESRIVFVPESRLRETLFGPEPFDITPARVVEQAREAGHEILADAIQELVVGTSSVEGGEK